MRCGWPTALSIFVGAALALALPSMAASAHTASQASTPVSTAPSLDRPSNRYSPRNHFFVEFRARSAASYGHVYVMYGEANAQHEVIRSSIAGFGPAGD